MFQATMTLIISFFIPNIDDHYEEWEIVNFHDFVAEKMNYKNAKEAIKSLEMKYPLKK